MSDRDPLFGVIVGTQGVQKVQFYVSPTDHLEPRPGALECYRAIGRAIQALDREIRRWAAQNQETYPSSPALKG